MLARAPDVFDAAERHLHVVPDAGKFVCQAIDPRHDIGPQSVLTSFKPFQLGAELLLAGFELILASFEPFLASFEPSQAIAEFVLASPQRRELR